MEKDPRFLQRHRFILKNLKCKYAYLFKADDKFGDPAWKIDLELPAPLAEEMKSVGFNVKLRKDENKVPIPNTYYITAKRKTHTRAGVALTPPAVWDDGRETKKPLPWPETKIIGNGSVVNVKVEAEYMEVGSALRLPLYLNAVQVVDLVPYGDNGFDAVEDDEDVPF